MQQANELLYGILQVVGRIEQNTRGAGGQSGVEPGAPKAPKSDASLLSNLGASLNSFKSANPKAIKTFFSFMDQMLVSADKVKKGNGLKDLSLSMINLGQALPGMTSGIERISSIKNINGALGNMQSLFNFIEYNGKIITAKISKNIKDLSVFMINLGQSLPGVGMGLDVIGKIKPKTIDKAIFNLRKLFDFLREAGKKKTTDSVKILTEALGALVKAMPGLEAGITSIAKIKEKSMGMALKSLGFLFTFIEDKGKPANAKKIQKGIDVMEKAGKALKGLNILREIGQGFMYLGLGVLAFAGSMVLSAMLLRLGKPSDILPFLGITILGLMVAFGALYLAKKFVKGGTEVIKDMGLGMAALALGIISFALTIRLLPVIFKNESGGSIIKGMLIMVGIIGIMALTFGVLSLAQPFVKAGFKTILLMSAGLAIFAITVLGLAMVAKMLMSGMTFDKEAEKNEKDENKKSMLKGLGIFGLILIGATAAFALLGIPGFSAVIKSGAVTMLLMGAALYVMALSIEKLVTVGERLAGKDIAGTLTNLIGGTITGFIGGLSALSGGKTGVAGVAAFIKNSAKIFAGVGVLMAMSLSLSMFAKAITAFAELENMRIIEGYDKDGKPIFGEKINITKVADNITYSISTFLNALIVSTEDLTRKKAGAIKKMARALTGRRGILTAVIQFADAMKVYAQFGKDNTIGYIDYDDNGNEIRQKVKANVVVDNMIGSFLYFTNQLFRKSEEEFGDGEPGISGKQKRRMKRMSKALVGKNGILGAVMQFADTLRLFAEFGKDNQIPILDADGKPTGKVLKVDDIADNIIEALMTFSDKLAVGLENSKPKDAKKAVAKFSGIIEELSKFSESLSALEKVNDTISNLAKSMNDLSVSLDGFDTAKLNKLSQISVAAGGPSSSGGSGSSTAERINEKSQAVKESSASAPLPVNWDLVAAQIGQHVGSSLVEAMKSGQMKFEFSPNGGGKGVLTFD